MQLDKVKQYTVIFIIAVIVAIAMYDVFAIYQGGTEASISNILIQWSYKYPAFTFLLGYTMGHLTWRMRDTDKTKELGR